CASTAIAARPALLLNQYAKKSPSTLANAWKRKPKQKLFRYRFGISSSRTEQKPTSSGVSEEPLKKRSPFFAQFCASPGATSTGSSQLASITLSVITFIKGM